MGLPLGGIGAGNDGHEKLVSWSGAVSWGEQELNETERYPLVRVTEQGMPTANLSCSPWHGRQPDGRSVRRRVEGQQDESQYVQLLSSVLDVRAAAV